MDVVATAADASAALAADRGAVARETA